MRFDEMDVERCGFLGLPLESRHLIYHTYFDSISEFGLLYVNRSIHHEAMQYLRQRQQEFVFHISGREAGFDIFSQRCFKIKGHVPRFSRMKHIILNIHPPDPDKPIQIWHIWHHVLSFCKEIASYRKIRRLTVNFIDDELKWATNGVPRSTMNLAYEAYHFCYSDVGQILAIFSRFVDNVENSKIVLSPSYLSSAHERAPYILNDAQGTEQLMTGRWTGWVEKNWADDFWWLNDEIRVEKHLLEAHTGRNSKAAFERIFGRSAFLDFKDFETFRQEWPYMEKLHGFERPRWRQACPSGCMCGGSTLEITFPEPSWRDRPDWDFFTQWHNERVGWQNGESCRFFSTRGYTSQLEDPPRWCHGEELQRRLFPQQGSSGYRPKINAKDKRMSERSPRRRCI